MAGKRRGRVRLFKFVTNFHGIGGRWNPFISFKHRCVEQHSLLGQEMAASPGFGPSEAQGVQKIRQRLAHGHRTQYFSEFDVWKPCDEIQADLVQICRFIDHQCFGREQRILASERSI